MVFGFDQQNTLNSTENQIDNNNCTPNFLLKSVPYKKEADSDYLHT